MTTRPLMPALALLAGCSLASRTINGPMPDWRSRDEQLPCERTLTWGTVDATLAITGLTLGAWGLWEEQRPLFESATEREGRYGTMGAIAASFGALFALSAIHGFVADRQCRRVNAGPFSWRQNIPPISTADIRRGWLDLGSFYGSPST